MYSSIRGPLAGFVRRMMSNSATQAPIAIAAGLLCAVLLPAVSAATTLAAGDIAFVGFNGDGDDDMAIVTFKDLDVNTIIRFSDNEWNGTSFNTGEDDFTWDSGAGVISAGTIVSFTNMSDAGTRGASVGSMSGGGLDLGVSGDAVFCFQGPAENDPTNFLAAIADEFANFTTLSNTGLSTNDSAVTLSANVDVAAYKGSRTKRSGVGFRALLIDFSTNWDSENGSGDQHTNGTPPGVPFDATSFVVVTGAPELAISTSDQSLTFLSNTIVIAGTVFGALGDLAYTNALSGDAGTVSAATNFTTPSIVLDIGNNVITITSTNEHGTSIDGVTITRRPIPPVRINEVYLNPPGTDDNREFMELFSTNGLAEGLDGFTVLELDSGGQIDEAWALSGASGANGLHVIGQAYDGAPIGGPWSNHFAAATTADDPTGLSTGSLNNDNRTYLLVWGFTGSVLDDLDGDDNFVLDTEPWTNLVDGIGVGSSYTNIAAIMPEPVAAPDSFARLLGENAINDVSAWYGGDMGGSGTDANYSGAAFNLPVGAFLTPGQPNFAPTPPSLGITTPSQTVPFSTNSIVISGVFTGALGSLVYTNQANGDEGTFAAVASWSSPAVSLSIGANAIDLVVTNPFGATTGTVTITRSEPPAVLINEAYINPQSIDDDREFIELIATNGTAADLTGLTLVLIDSVGSGVGNVNEHWSLDGLATGANGLILIGKNYDVVPVGGPWSNLIAAGTTVGYPVGLANGNVGGNSDFTLLLVADSTISAATDLDTDDNLVLDSAPWARQLDGVGFGSTYTDAVTVVEQGSDAPDTIARARGNVSTNDSAAWYGGEIPGSGASVVYSTTLGETFHVPTGSGFEMTPGNPNFAAPAVAAPTLLVNTLNQTVGVDTTTINIEGVVTNALGGMNWTNSLTGSNATLAATVSWTISTLDLALGVNTITVSASNFVGTTSSAVTITRITASPILINEVCFNPIGADDDSEFIELINPGGGVTNLALLWLLFIESDPGDAAVGDIIEKWDLSNFQTGPNGLALFGDGYASGPGGPWSNLVAAATSNGTPITSSTLSGGDLINSDITLLLVFDFNDPGAADDVDTDDDLVMDTNFWASIVDAIGFGSTYTNEVTLLPTSGDPDTVARFRGNSQTNDPSAWFGSDLVPGGADTTTTYNTGSGAAFNIPPDAGMTPGSPNINNDFKITNIAVSGASVNIPLGKGGDLLTYQIFSADGSVNATYTLVATEATPPTGGFIYQDATILTDPSITLRFYKVVEIDGSIIETNPARWFVMKQSRNSDAWHMVGAPVQHDPASDLNVRWDFGDQLAHGLLGQVSEMTAPNVYFRDTTVSPAGWTNFHLAADRRWRTAAGSIADYPVNPSMGMFLKPQPTDPGTSNGVFAGQTHTNAQSISLVSNEWVLFAWPFAQSQSEGDGTGAEQGWNFDAQGGTGGTGWNDSDRMFMESGGRYYNLYLGSDGRWKIQNTTGNAPVALEFGKAYYYFTRGTTFNFTPTAAN